MSRFLNFDTFSSLICSVDIYLFNVINENTKFRFRNVVATEKLNFEVHVQSSVQVAGFYINSKTGLK